MRSGDITICPMENQGMDILKARFVKSISLSIKKNYGQIFIVLYVVKQNSSQF